MKEISLILTLLLGVIQWSAENQLKSEKNDFITIQAKDFDEKLKDIEEPNKLKADYKEVLGVIKLV